MNHRFSSLFCAVLLATLFALPAAANEDSQIIISTLPDGAQSDDSTQSSNAYNAEGLVLTLPSLNQQDEQPEPQFESVPLPDPLENFEGSVDTITSMPVDDDALNKKDGVTILEDGHLGYHNMSGHYRLYCGSAYAECNLPGGAVVNSGTGLIIYGAPGLQMALLCNNQPVSEFENALLTEPGTYQLSLTDNSGSTISYNFVLVNGATNQVNEIFLPKGFRFTHVELDDVEQTPEFTNYFDCLVDGHYAIQWSCPGLGIYYSADFQLDRQAPTLTLPEVVNGMAEKSVTLTDLEPGAIVRYTIDGGTEHVVSEPGAVLSAPGHYNLSVSDAAGNTSYYEFRVRASLDIRSGTALLLLVSALLSLLVYSIRLRRHARVY